MTESRSLVRIPKGSYLFKQNDRSADLFIVKSGRVRIFKTEGNTDIELDTVGTGGVVGEIAAMDGGRRSGSVFALQDTEVYVISTDEFRSVLSGIPEWFRKIAKILVQRLREVDEKIDNTVSGDRAAHAAALIALMTYSSAGRAESGGHAINLKFLENELVDILSIGLLEVGEILERLAKQKLLIMEKSRVVVADRTKIEAFAGSVIA